MITSLLDTTKRQPDTEYFNKTTTETDQHGVNTGTSNSRRHRHNNIPAQIQILTSMKDGKVDWLEFWHLTALSTQTDHGYRVPTESDRVTTNKWAACLTRHSTPCLECCHKMLQAVVYSFFGQVIWILAQNLNGMVQPSLPIYSDNFMTCRNKNTDISLALSDRVRW